MKGTSLFAGCAVLWLLSSAIDSAATAPAPPISELLTPAPLYRDPVFDGAADPVLVWNPQRKAWWMCYTQRRAKLNLRGVAWAHGTEIGVAESTDHGMTWNYVGQLPLSHPDPGYSFWAPDVILDDEGTYHFFVTYVPGDGDKHVTWDGPRFIFQYTSKDLWNWEFFQKVPTTSDRCIDPSLCRRPDGAWRMWFKDEAHNSDTFALETRDLKEWRSVQDPGVSKRYGEGPKVFPFQGYYWLIKDPGNGLDVYRSPDLDTWTYQGKILDTPGRRNDDAAFGQHADVVVSGTRTFIIYFTHPYGQDFPEKDGVMPLAARRSSLQAAELEVRDGVLFCDRDKPFRIELSPPTPTDHPRGVKIDRHALVTRHNIEWNELRGQIPLGNGEFCFNVDATGLQTFGGNTLSHWAWHSAPLPAGFTPSDIPPTGTVETGRIKGPMVKAAERSELNGWMFQNPHPMNLGRLRWLRGTGAELKSADVGKITRQYDLWTGVHTSHFEVDGQPVTVETCVHPALDLVAVRAQSPLLRDGKLVVCLDFPYPTVQSRSPWCGDWNRQDAHTTQWTLRSGEDRADISRTADDSNYRVSLAWSKGCTLRPGRQASDAKHRLTLAVATTDQIEFVCGFSSQALGLLPTGSETRDAVAAHWQRFWSTGGAIDLSQSKDPRWPELERRIVLSQYQMAAQSAGSWPSAETGLMGLDAWSSQFHMEMVWWHLAHYGLWDRWAMAERALDCYQRFLPVARQLARQFDYQGVKWGKQVGPEGRTAPWEGSFVLHWQQPHPIFFAELEYRLRPNSATLKKWQDVVFGTADYMADFPTPDGQGLYHLQPIMPPSEQGVTRDTVFDLAYWRWGFAQAQLWRERLGLSREPRWDEVRQHLAPLPTAEGVFVHSAEWKDTYTKRAWEHPDPVGVLGMLPPLEGVDRETACKRRSKSAAGVRCLTGRGLARGGTFKHGEECMSLWNNGPRSADECWWKE